MKKSITKFVVATGLFLAGLIGISHTENVLAANTALKVAPTQFHINLDPGQVYSDTLRFTNESDREIVYTVSALPYNLTENGDSSGYEVSYTAESSYNIIKDWISFNVTEGKLAPDESVAVNFTINVPNDAPGGGQYAIIALSTSVRDGDSSKPVSVGENVIFGPVIYATMSGDTQRTAEILSNDVSGFYLNPPIVAKSRVKNTGNVHAEAAYIMRVFPFFGGESIYNNEEKPAVEIVYPDTSRYFSLAWNEAPAIGIFKVESEVHIFDEVSKIEKTIIICPVWVLILIAIFIIAIIFWIVSRVRARKAER